MMALPRSTLALVEAFSRELVHRDKVSLERRLASTMRRIFRAQSKALMSRLIPEIRFLFQEASVAPIAIHLVDVIVNGSTKPFEADIARLLLSALEKGSLRTRTDVRLTADFRLPATRQAQIVREQGARLVANVNETTREAVRQIISDGLDNHSSYQQVAKLLRERFSEFGTKATQKHIRDRATLIATTEIGDAYSRGQLETAARMVELGLEVEKAWLTVGEACPICDANEAEGWLDSEGSFSSGHDAPTAHPACRCALKVRSKPAERAA